MCLVQTSFRDTEPVHVLGQNDCEEFSVIRCFAVVFQLFNSGRNLCGILFSFALLLNKEQRMAGLRCLFRRSLNNRRFHGQKTCEGCVYVFCLCVFFVVPKYKLIVVFIMLLLSSGLFT